jgi:hypothetical protein
MKQTAVEWLIGQISEKQPNGMCLIYTLDDVKNVFESALQMEKEQIIAARQDGYDSTTIDCDSGCSSSFSLDGTNDQYYKETYGGKP